MRIFIYVLISILFTGCILFSKFNGTDVLYKEGKKSKSYTEYKRLWCSNCGCEAIKINKYERNNLVMEMLLNCTQGCPPGDRSYKVERKYDRGELVSEDYYFLASSKHLGIEQVVPLSHDDSLLIEGVSRFKDEWFYKQNCATIPYQFKGYIKTNASKIIKFPTGEKGL
jgi:hypothetical protein